MSMSNCQHEEVFKNNCVRCGIFIHKQTGVCGIKSNLYEDQETKHASLKNLRKSITNFHHVKSNYLLKPEVKEIFSLLMSRLMVSRQTYTLASYLLETNTQIILSNFGFDHEYGCKMLAISCFLLAIKILQINYKNPKVSDVNKILKIQINKQEIMKIEILLVQKSSYVVTFLDFINIYLCNGGIFSFQNIRDPQKFQLKVNEICWQYIKNGSFLMYNQQRLAVYILYRVRKQFKILQIWNCFLEQITKVSKSQVLEIVNQFEPKLNQYQQNNTNRKGDAKNSLMDQNSHRISLLNIQQSLNRIKKSYSRLRNETLSPTPRLQCVRSGSSINKRCYRVQ